MINMTTLIFGLLFSRFWMLVFLAMHSMESVSLIIRFARASSCVACFGARGELLTQRLLKQRYRCRRLRRTFSKFYG